MLFTGCASQPVIPRTDPLVFDLMEIEETFQAPMREATLQRWRDRAPEGFRHFVTAWKAFTADPLDERQAPVGLESAPRDQWGLLRPTPLMQEHWKAFRTQLRVLKAAGVVFRTPVGFSPSQANRDAMAAFFRDVVGDIDALRIWMPGGLWDPEDARETADELGLVLAVDPFIELDFPEPSAGPAYYVLTGPYGGRRRFSDDDLDIFLDFAREHEHDVHAVFRGSERFLFAERLRRLARRSQEGGDD